MSRGGTVCPYPAPASGAGTTAPQQNRSCNYTSVYERLCASRRAERDAVRLQCEQLSRRNADSIGRRVAESRRGECYVQASDRHTDYTRALEASTACRRGNAVDHWHARHATGRGTGVDVARVALCLLQDVPDAL